MSLATRGTICREAGRRALTWGQGEDGAPWPTGASLGDVEYRGPVMLVTRHATTCHLPTAWHSGEPHWDCCPITFLTLLSRWQSAKTTCGHPCCFSCSRTFCGSRGTSGTVLKWPHRTPASSSTPRAHRLLARVGQVHLVQNQDVWADAQCLLQHGVTA